MGKDTIYLIVAAGLIFGAGAGASKKILRQLTLKQMLVIAPIAIAMVVLIWMFLTVWTRPPQAVQPTSEITSGNEATPLLQPDQD